jgi:uncharacterized membrane protein
MTAIFMGHNVFIKVSSATSIKSLVRLFFVVAALLGGIILNHENIKYPLEITQKGVGFAVLSGVLSDLQ